MPGRVRRRGSKGGSLWRSPAFAPEHVERGIDSRSTRRATPAVLDGAAARNASASVRLAGFGQHQHRHGPPARRRPLGYLLLECAGAPEDICVAVTIGVQQRAQSLAVGVHERAHPRRGQQPRALRAGHHLAARIQDLAERVDGGHSTSSSFGSRSFSGSSGFTVAGSAGCCGVLKGPPELPVSADLVPAPPY